MKVFLTQEGIDFFPADLYDDDGMTISNLMFLTHANVAVSSARHLRVICLAHKGTCLAFINYGATDEEMYQILDVYLVKIKVVVDY